MRRLDVPLWRGQSSRLDTDWHDALLVNMHFVPKRVLGGNGHLRSSYGLTQFTTGFGIDRGGYYNSNCGDHFRVSGDRLVTLSTTGGVTDIGQIPGSLPVTMTNTFLNQVLTTDGSSYLHNDTDGLRDIAALDVDVGQPIDSVFLNRTLVHTDGDFLIPSNVGFDEVYELLNRGVAESLPDGILGLGALYNKLVVFGRYSTEWFFFDNSLTGFPFRRIEQQLIRTGVVGTNAKTYYPDNNGVQTYAFIGGAQDEPPAVRLLSQGSAPKISTREVDQVLSEYTEAELSTATLERRKLEHNDFLVCHLPRHVLMFDRAAAEVIGVNAWSIHRTDTLGATPARWVNGVFDPRLSRWVYGDKIDARLGLLDKEVCTHYGSLVTEYFYTPLMPLAGKSVHKMTMEHLPGRGHPNASPTLFLSATTNGLVYGGEHLVKMGVYADYERRFEKRRLGYFKGVCGFRFRKTDDTPIAVTTLALEVS